MKRAATTITLQEYKTIQLPASTLTQEAGTLLWRTYDKERGVLSVAFPSPRNDQQWELTPRGWVGLIRATPQLELSLEPRMPVDDLFGMLEVALGLRSFHFLPGIVFSDSLAALYERLAVALAQRVLRRARKGLYGGYEVRRERLLFVRGRMALGVVRRPAAQPSVTCDYEEFTVDVPHNQILAWTLSCIAQARFCSEPAQAMVRRALRTVTSHVSLTPVTAGDCVARDYGRLDADYAEMHALCRFFLEHHSPTHRSGEKPMIPFLVNMPRLYEQFAAQCLREQLPPPWSLASQEMVSIAGNGRDVESGVRFTIDLVLYDGADVPRVVLDTKYRPVQRADAEDVAQVVAYAQSKGCRQAVLIYPQP
ncbi:MAG TPA: restriction endonuclease, partial [Candidatus Binatia bacterium]|nr:restriction endonuclease [Candidatus Binatia bacterium]